MAPIIIETPPLEEVIRTLPGYDPYKDSDGYHFDLRAAEKACRFYPTLLRHVKGRRWAGKRFHLSPYQLAVTANTYGWKDDATGLRRYRELFMYVPKKNGKTAWGAGQVIMGLVYDGEPGAEIYSAAYCKEQASLVYFFASRMVLQQPALNRRLRCYGTSGASVARSINYPAMNSKYRPLASDADAIDGPDVHMAVIDELHRHRKPEMARLLEKNTAARDQPLIIYLTTADYSRPSLCNQKLKKARDVIAGRISDPQFLPCIYEAQKEDDWEDPATWAKANPNYNVTVSEAFLKREAQKARDNPAELLSFLRLHLNIVTDAENALIPERDWSACRGRFGPNDRKKLERFLKGRPCYGGLDLADTEDLNALVLLFEVKGQLYPLPFFWVPEQTAAERERKTGLPYSSWIREGWIRTVPGKTTNYKWIRKAITKELAKRYEIQEIGYDPNQALQLSHELEDDGIKVFKVLQVYSHLSSPTMEFLRLLRAGEISHSGNPVLTWMSGNVTGEYDTMERVRPSKQKSTEKIDGIAALVIAIARWQLKPGPPPVSAYETEELTQCDF